MLTYAPQTSDAKLQVHVGSDWAGDLLGRKNCQERQTFA